MKDQALTAIAATAPMQGTSNPIKGAKYHGLAIEFVKEWPIGSKLTWQEFCEWAYLNELLENPQPEVTSKQSDVWLAHLQRRHQARMNVNKASQHSDMLSYGGAFSIEAIRGVLAVKDVAKVMAEGNAARRITSLAKTKRKQLEYLFQSTDWALLPPHERAIAESLKDDIDNWVELIDLQAKQHEQKFLKLKSRLSSLVKIGEINPQNGGISGLLESSE